MSAALAGHHGSINIRLSFPHPLLVQSGHVESTPMYAGDCDAAIAKAAATAIHVQSLSQEVSFGDEGLGLIGFDVSSGEEMDFWWLEDEQ